VIALYRTIDLLFRFLSLAVIARVLFSWIRPDPTIWLVRLVYDITEPILDPIRRALPLVGGIDFSPFVALLLLDLAERALLVLLF
jgi:YggT family protein